MQRKTLIIIIAVAAAVVVAGLLVFFLVYNEETAVIGEKANQQGFLPEGGEGDGQVGDGISSEFPALSLPIFSQIVDSETLDPDLADSGEEINYFDIDTGDFHAVGIDGKGNEALSEKQFAGVKSVVWAPDGDSALLTFKSEDSDQEKIYLYDLFTKSLKKLGSHITSPAFSPDGEFIVYQYIDDEKRIYNISKSKPDGTGFSKIKDFYSPMCDIDWESSFNKIFITDYPSNQTLSNLQAISPTKGTLSKFVEPKYGIMAEFSPDGSGAVYSFISSDGSELKLIYVDENGNFVRELFLATFASKAVISHDGKYAYVAVPTNLPQTITIRDYLPDGKSLTKDQIWRIDLSTGDKQMLVNPEEYGYVIDAYNPFLSHDGKLMFFWDKGDKGIYAVNLAKAEEAAGLTSGSSSGASKKSGTGNLSTETDRSTDTSSDSASDSSGTDTADEGGTADDRTPEERMFDKAN